MKMQFKAQRHVFRSCGMLHVEPLETRRMCATLTTLVNFDGYNGLNPQAKLTLTGNTLYGTTYRGGMPFGGGSGTVFSVPITGGEPTRLSTFNDSNGADPYGALIFSGNTLYGTTLMGGLTSHGTVFSVPVTGGEPTTLVTFNGDNGYRPFAGLTLLGNTLYGTTINGGSTSRGTVFSVPVTGGEPTTLGTFNTTNGAFPFSGLTLSGNTLYGTTVEGGGNNFGTVFSVPVTGGTPTTLATFNSTNGAGPRAGLILSGNTLYGTTVRGGANNFGTVFSVPLIGGVPTTLATFNKTNGAFPYDLLLSENTLYGTTGQGGTSDRGTVFSVPVAGGAPTTLVTFDGKNGASPGSGLIADATGNLYGTTANGGANDKGTVFKITNSGFVIPAPEVEVRGSDVGIADGDNLPTMADFTDFGTVDVGAPITRTFTVKNTGSVVLKNSGLVVPAGFTIINGLASNIQPGGHDTFTVRFNASLAGSFAGTVAFTNNDTNENPYNYRIKGTVKAATVSAKIEVRGNNVVINDNDTTPAATDFTNFGNAALNATVTRTFTVQNWQCPIDDQQPPHSIEQ